MEAGAEGGLRVRLPREQAPGLIWLEAERGALLSAPRPLLLLPGGCQALAAELEALLADARTASSHGWQGRTARAAPC